MYRTADQADTGTGGQSRRRRPRRWARRIATVLLASVSLSAVAQDAASAAVAPPVHLTAQPLDATPSPAGRKLLVNAHNAGDTVPTALQAVRAHTGMVEIDVNWGGSELVAAHALVPGFIPGEAADLSGSWAASSGAPATLLDLKSRSRPGLAAVARLINADPGRTTYLSTPSANTLDTVHRAAPRTVALLSITNPRQLQQLLTGRSQVRGLAGVSINQRLLTRPLVDALRDQHLLVQAYTVDQVSRANQLAGWGVTGITTNSLTIMQALAEQPTFATVADGKA